MVNAMHYIILLCYRNSCPYDPSSKEFLLAVKLYLNVRLCVKEPLYLIKQ